MTDDITTNPYAEAKAWSKPRVSGTEPAGRDFHTAVTLPDDTNVLVFGGSRELGEAAEFFNDAHVFDTGGLVGSSAVGIVQPAHLP